MLGPYIQLPPPLSKIKHYNRGILYSYRGKLNVRGMFLRLGGGDYFDIFFY